MEGETHGDSMEGETLGSNNEGIPATDADEAVFILKHILLAIIEDFVERPQRTVIAPLYKRPVLV